MNIRWIGLLAVASLACVDRVAPTSEFAPTAQEICVDFCEFAEDCWHEEVIANPFPTVEECIEVSGDDATARLGAHGERVHLATSLVSLCTERLAMLFLDKIVGHFMVLIQNAAG